MWSRTTVCRLIPTSINLCPCVWLWFFTPKLIQKFYFKLITVNMFFGCHKPVLANSSVRDLGTRVDFQSSSTDFSLRYSSRSFKKCRALRSRLLNVGRDHSGKICPPVVGTDTFIGVVDKHFRSRHFHSFHATLPISTLSVLHHELDAQGSLTALLPNWPGCTWFTSDKAELLGCTLVLFAILGIRCLNPATALSSSANACALASS